MLEVIIENGCHFLQTPEGEKLPRIIATKINQSLRDPGKCEFLIFVNDEGCCKYNQTLNALISPGGQLLPVEVIEFRAKSRNRTLNTVLCKCLVQFPHNTMHKAHFKMPEPAKDAD